MGIYGYLWVYVIVAWKKGGGRHPPPTKIFVGQQKKYLRTFFYPLGSAASKTARIFFFWSDVYIGWFSLLTKKPHLFKAKTEFFTQNGLFQGVFRGPIWPPKYRKNHVLPLWKCPTIRAPMGVLWSYRNPNKPLEMPFEVGLGVPKYFFWKSPKIATLGRFGPFLGHFGLFLA